MTSTNCDAPNVVNLILVEIIELENTLSRQIRKITLSSPSAMMFIELLHIEYILI
jgi:hypothetical protein